MNNTQAAIILAAGMGKRMKSDLPKVLHEINGKPLIRHLLETMATIALDRLIVVIGHKGDMVIRELRDFEVDFVWQKEQLGTGHAVLMARDYFKDFNGTVLIASGDVPFLSAGSINGLFAIHRQNEASATCLSAEFDNPAGYGRIIRKPETDILLDIIEEKDADPETKKIHEINTGTFCFKASELFATLEKVGNNNAQGEYYLTDTIKILQAEGKPCAVSKAANAGEVAGINSIEQLKNLELALNQKKA